MRNIQLYPHREGGLAALPGLGRMVRQGALLAMLGTAVVGVPSQAEVGAGDPNATYVAIRVTFPTHVTYSSLEGTIESFSEQDGSMRTDYVGAADFYLPGKAPKYLGHHVRHVVVRGTAAGPREAFEISLSRSERRTLARTARKEHIKFFRMRLRLRDVTEGRQPVGQTKINTRRRVFVK